MAVTVTKSEGVTVLTFKTDPNSACPPLCQILKGLLYNPLCCGVSQYLKMKVVPVLGTLQVTLAVMSIGLSAILCNTRGASWWEMDFTGFPFWLGGLFIAFGIFSFLSERFSSLCLVIIHVILQLVGVCLGIASVVLFSINITQIRLWRSCDPEPYDYYYPRREQHAFSTTPLSPHERRLRETCLDGNRLALMLMVSINAVLIVLSALQLCIAITLATFGIKALKNRDKKHNKSDEEPEHYKPLLDDVSTNADLKTPEQDVV